MQYLASRPKRKTEHGGVFALNSRRSRRPIDVKKPVHLVLRSDLAKGRRSLLKNQVIVLKVLYKFSFRFRIRIYEKAVCGNHIHLLVRAKTRRELQNFFRVSAGQIAQEILVRFPLQKHENKAFVSASKKSPPMHQKNQRTFWSLFLYTRIVSWGRDFCSVRNYVVRNTLEALGIIPYQERNSRFSVFVQSG